jgi:hypothetical protein
MGLRLSLIELKTFIYVLITNFVFAETDEKVVKANVCVNVALISPYWGTPQAEDVSTGGS